MNPNEIIATVLRASIHRFIGRLAADPAIRYFETGTSKAEARIAINRPGAKKDDGQEPDWFKVEVWGDQAQPFADQCRKGALVQLEGRVKTDRWTDRNTGEERMQLVVTADSWALVGGQAAQPAAAAAPPAAAAAPPAAQQTASAPQPVWNSAPTHPAAMDDGSIPF